MPPTNAVPLTTVTCLLWGALGGVFLELCHWYAIRHKPKWPTYVRRPGYWIVTLGMVFFGAIIALLLMRLGGGVMSEINAFAVGFMAPSFQTKLKDYLPDKPQLGVAEPTGSPESFRDFFDW